MLSRRDFVRIGGAAVMSLGTGPLSPAKAAVAAERPRLLIAVFQRGGVDGLNMVVPFTERAYYQARPSIAVAPPGRGADRAIDLDGTFALHPRLAPFKPLWDSRQLAIVHACGAPVCTRRHLAAQDYVERAVSDATNTDGGWLHRGRNQWPRPRSAPRHGAQYPQTAFGQALQHLASLARADEGPEAAFAEVGPWDHHVSEGGATGQLAGQLGEFAGALSALVRDLGDRMEDTVIVTMSEFGRTVSENGAGGTDHGHGNAMFVIGGRVSGGRVYGQWPGLSRDALHEGRDLAVTTDVRSVIAQAATRPFGLDKKPDGVGRA